MSQHEKQWIEEYFAAEETAAEGFDYAARRRELLEKAAQRRGSRRAAPGDITLVLGLARPNGNSSGGPEQA